MVVCYLGLGSNLGNRKRNIKLAVKKISELKDTRIIKKSSLFDSNPVGGPAGQRNYLNGALKIKTKFTPPVLLKKLEKIEEELGRIPTLFLAQGLSIWTFCFMGTGSVQSKALTIPHPRMFSRDFVIRPLKEVL